MSEERSGHACPEPEVLLAQVEREDAATLEHLAACPRCRALVAACRDFTRPDPATSAPRQAEAEDALARFLAGEFRADAARVPEPRGFRAVLAEALSALTRYRFAWAATAAAVLVVSVLVWQGARDRQPDRIRLRRGAAGTSTADERVTTEPPRLLEDGSLELRWQPFEGANAYRIVLLAPSTLEEAIPPKRVSATRTVLDPAELKSAAGAGGALMWQVVALADGDSLATSRAAILEIPTGR